MTPPSIVVKLTMYQKEEKWLLEEKYKGEKSKGFFTDLNALQSGTPLAYLIGSIPFLGCTIYLDSHPLIPRTETEFWTEKAIIKIRHNLRGLTPNSEELGVKPLRILDLCAGSGAIGVSVAKTIPESQVDFAEIDPLHLPTIQKNIINNLPENSNSSSSRFRLELESKYTVFLANLFTSAEVRKASSRRNLELGKYDFILTNPPYIDPKIDRIEASVRLHEPALALYGGTNGMECIQKIIEQAHRHLTKNGQLWIEHEPEQSVGIQRLAKAHSFTCTTHNDQYDIERYSILMLQ